MVKEVGRRMKVKGKVKINVEVILLVNVKKFTVF